MKVLHLVGSAVSEYYEGVSILYARACIESTVECDFENLICYVLPATAETNEVMISFPKDLVESSLKNATQYVLHQGLSEIMRLGAEIVVPHMYCWPGMTTLRSILDMLGLPILGSSGHVMALSTDKIQSRAIVHDAGVKVAPAIVLRKNKNGDAEDISKSIGYPCVIKPAREDNSMGIRLVTKEADLHDALENAFQFDDIILCEKYIPLGREIRVAVLENTDGSLQVLPCLEYFLNDENHAIRTSDDKLQTNGSTVLGLASGGRQCPAHIQEPLLSRLTEAAKKAHLALGCSYYSLYDFRIDPSDTPYFLEACLYCSFASKSVVVTMANATGQPDLLHPKLYATLVSRCASKGNKESSSLESRGTQLYGMRKNQ